MRPIVALAISLVLLGSIYAYTRFANSVHYEPTELVATMASGEFRLVITRSFDIEGDTDFQSDGLFVKFKDVLIKRADFIPRTEPIEIFPLQGVEEQFNVLRVEARPKPADPDSFEHSPAAIRVQVIRDFEIVADETFWQQEGQDTVFGDVSLRIVD